MMSPRWRCALIVAAIVTASLLAVGGFLALSKPDWEPRSALVSGPDAVALGRMIYGEACASCHGARLEGEADWRQQRPDGGFPAPPHDQSGHTWHHPDAMLLLIIKHGGQAVAPLGFKSGMPGFTARLSDREIAAVLSYIKSQWPAAVQEHQRQITLQAQGRE